MWVIAVIVRCYGRYHHRSILTQSLPATRKCVMETAESAGSWLKILEMYLVKAWVVVGLLGVVCVCVVVVCLCLDDGKSVLVLCVCVCVSHTRTRAHTRTKCSRHYTYSCRSRCLNESFRESPRIFSVISEFLRPLILIMP